MTGCNINKSKSKLLTLMKYSLPFSLSCHSSCVTVRMSEWLIAWSWNRVQPSILSCDALCFPVCFITVFHNPPFNILFPFHNVDIGALIKLLVWMEWKCESCCESCSWLSCTPICKSDNQLSMLYNLLQCVGQLVWFSINVIWCLVMQSN